ncbi:hypothetical protein D3C79_1047920 [compost metagenome]
MHCGALADTVKPGAQVAEIVEIEIDDAGDVHPAEGGNVGDAVLRAGQPVAVFQVAVQRGEGVFGEASKAFDNSCVRCAFE